MCNCANEISEKLVDHVKKEIETEPGFQKIEASYFSNRVFVIAESGLTSAPIIIPFKVEYTRKAKTSGKVRTYKKETSIRPSFCPFCGQEYDR